MRKLYIINCFRKYTFLIEPDLEKKSIFKLH